MTQEPFAGAPEGQERPTRDPFDADGAAWTSVSRRLTTARWIVFGLFWASVLVLIGMPLTALGAWSALPGWVPWALLGIWLAVLAWVAWLLPRQVRAWAYAERPEELLVRSGIMFRRLVVVPYGRLQYVDVAAGPLARRFGFASVQLHTASPGSDAAIPGVPAADAARLRERLTARGQAQLAGL